MKLLINASSDQILGSIISNLPQSLLITGDYGVGLGTVAKYIANQLQVTPQMILPEFDEKIDLEKGIISIDIIRRLYEDTKTKTTTKHVIIIDYAERMTTQAQNAFLKLLEEPNPGTYFIILSHVTNKLLPTILSRVEKLELRPISNKQSEKLLDELNIKDATKRSQILFFADGLPAEITRLATDQEYFDSRSAIIRDAKTILSGNLYQKLLIAHKYKDSRNSALALLSDVAKILEKSVSADPDTNTFKHINKILKSYELIAANGNIRLGIANMVI